MHACCLDYFCLFSPMEQRDRVKRPRKINIDGVTSMLSISFESISISLSVPPLGAPLMGDRISCKYKNQFFEIFKSCFSSLGRV
jgi:hypothetical protein